MATDVVGAGLAGEPPPQRWRIGGWTDPLLALHARGAFARAHGLGERFGWEAFSSRLRGALRAVWSAKGSVRLQPVLGRIVVAMCAT
jgi:hypothetical protein